MSLDASFGLTELQSDRGARPELWNNRQPGMCYLDAPSIDDSRLAMPMNYHHHMPTKSSQRKQKLICFLIIQRELLL